MRAVHETGGTPPAAFDWLMPLAPWEDPEVLKQTLLSLTRQTAQARALVVSVDGQLPAGLLKVLENSGLRLEIHEAIAWQGTGPVLARGLLACRSELVLRIDADDASLPERSSWQVKQLLENPSLAVLGGQLEEVSISEMASPRKTLRTVPFTASAIRERSQWQNPMNHPTVALRRSQVLKAGNYRNCPYFEDWDLWLRMIRDGMVLRNDPRVLVRARVGSEHLSRRHGFKYARAEVNFLFHAGTSGCMPWRQVVVLMLIRLPLRILPKRGLQKIMSHLLRRHGRKEQVGS